MPKDLKYEKLCMCHEGSSYPAMPPPWPPTISEYRAICCSRDRHWARDPGSATVSKRRRRIAWPTWAAAGRIDQGQRGYRDLIDYRGAHRQTGSSSGRHCSTSPDRCARSATTSRHCAYRLPPAEQAYESAQAREPVVLTPSARDGRPRNEPGRAHAASGEGCTRNHTWHNR